MASPDFIGIGAQKAGTTWLYHALSAHPQIWTTLKKEIHYFNKGSDWRDPKIEAMKKERLKDRMGQSRLQIWRWYRNYARLPRDDRWYASLFTPRRGQIAGEVTPDYFVLDKADIGRVRSVAPEAKIIFFMRNPIERAWSHALMDMRRRGMNPEAMAVSELREFFERGYVSKRSKYMRILGNWSSFFPEEQLFAGFLEDTHFHTYKLLEDVYGFLGVDPNFKPPGMRRKINSRARESMPADTARYLALSYHDDLESLREHFGGYASFWLHCADKLIEGSFDEAEGRVPYPLWRSSAWSEWTNNSEETAAKFVLEKPQSGPLSTMSPIS